MKMYLGISILCMAIVPRMFCYEDIHKYMSSEEIQNVFHTDADSVPEYEVVKLHMPERLHKRDLPSGSRFHMTAFGENINLWLHPRDSILAGVDTPVYYAKYSQLAPGAVEYRPRPGLMGMVGKIFEDPNKMASLVIGTEDTGRTRVNGHIASNRIAVRSLPQRVVDEYSRRRRRSVDDFEHPQHSPYHVVIKMNETFEENYSRSLVNVTRLQERLSRSVTGVPETLYPEILVVLDYSVYTTYDTPQGHDIYRLLEYLLAFWNGVDLKYRSIETPRIRLHISAIVLPEDPYATPYIARNMVSRTAFNSKIALSQARYFYYAVRATFPLESYDIATTMTRHQFGIESGVMGVAWIGSACRRNNFFKTTDAVTIYYDNGQFIGLLGIAHELGHIFGASHDNETGSCLWSDGYIMASPPRITANSSDFSSCSMETFQQHLDGQNLSCLYNPPTKDGENLPKLMPGRKWNLEAQCKEEKGGASCQHEHPEYSICEKMYCEDETGQCMETMNSALDGTKCGDKNQFCLHQQCVSL